MRILLLTLLTLALGLLGGCLQIEITIQMHEDGAATVTERVQFSQTLLELDSASASGLTLAPLLERPAVESRMKEMGKGIVLVSHQVTTRPDGGRESVAVFKIPEIDDLRLVNPYLSQGDPNRLMRLEFTPIYKVVHSFHALGELMLEVVPADARRRDGGPPASQPQAPPPAQMQMFRHIQPMAADLMKGFQVKVRLITNRPVNWGWVRDRASATKIIDLISFNDEDLDAFGMRFVDNEELMLSLLRLQFDAENIADHVQGFSGNPTVPVFRCRKPYGSGTFRVPPNQHQFQKYFAGKPKSQGGDQPG